MKFRFRMLHPPCLKAVLTCGIANWSASYNDTRNCPDRRCGSGADFHSGIDALARPATGPGLLVAFGVALLPGGLIALSWQERVARFRRRAVGFLHFLVHRDHHARLI